MQETIKVNKNITLNYIPMTKLKTTAIGLFLHRELNRHESSYNALLPYVLKFSSNMCDGREKLAHYLDNIYGAKFSTSISKKGNDHILCFEAETISDKFAPNGEKLTENLLELVLSVVFDAKEKFDNTVFESERNNAITRLENIINDKRTYASFRVQEEISKGDIFEISRLGYKEDYENMTAQGLYEHYRKIVTSSPIDIYICGDTDISKIEDKIKEYISKLEFLEASICKTDILKKNSKVNNITEKMNVTQGKLSMGFLTDTKSTDKDIFALILGNAIFGGGAQSKLFNNVREKLSLAYYASSSLNKSKGFMVVNAGIEFSNFEKAYNEILLQLEEMKNGNIEDLEFEASKNFIINSLNSFYDDQFGLISYYLGEKVVGTNVSIEEYKEKIIATTKENVKNAMSKVRLDTVYFLTGGDTN